MVDTINMQCTQYWCSGHIYSLFIFMFPKLVLVYKTIWHPFLKRFTTFFNVSYSIVIDGSLSKMEEHYLILK